MSSEEILFEAEESMEKAVDHLRMELRGIRTGRANPGLVENIRVDYYGSPTPLKQIANIGVPEPAMLGLARIPQFYTDQSGRGATIDAASPPEALLACEESRKFKPRFQHVR